MIGILLALDLVFLVVAFGIRTAVHLRRTSDAGWRLGRPNSAAEGIARAAMFLSPVLVGTGFVVGSDGGAPGVGVAMCVAAIAFVFVAQLQMGSSWRIGVDPAERTELVTSGLYQWVRNPIYLGMAVFVIGQTAAYPNLPNLLGTIVMVAGVEIQVRAVEEPYLLRVHGAAFTAWAKQSGRFLPGLG